MRKELGQESLPAGKVHLYIISSLCLVKLLSHGANFFLCLVFNLTWPSLQVHNRLVQLPSWYMASLRHPIHWLSMWESHIWACPWAPQDNAFKWGKLKTATVFPCGRPQLFQGSPSLLKSTGFPQKLQFHIFPHNIAFYGRGAGVQFSISLTL